MDSSAANPYRRGFVNVVEASKRWNRNDDNYRFRMKHRSRWLHAETVSRRAIMTAQPTPLRFTQPQATVPAIAGTV